MTSVWFASTGSGEDGDPWDVHEVFATKELAEAYCNRPDKPVWEHPYVQEWEVTGSLLTDKERAALERVCVAYELLPTVGAKQVADTLSNLLERLT